MWGHGGGGDVGRALTVGSHKSPVADTALGGFALAPIPARRETDGCRRGGRDRDTDQHQTPFTSRPADHCHPNATHPAGEQADPFSPNYITQAGRQAGRVFLGLDSHTHP